MLVWTHRVLFPHRAVRSTAPRQAGRGRVNGTGSGLSHLGQRWRAQAQVFRGAGSSRGPRLVLIGFPVSVGPPVPSVSPCPPLGGAGGLPLDGASGLGGPGGLGEAGVLLFPFPLDRKGGDPGGLR